ncbi:MAG TPA: hypothetical protein VFT37_10150 [Telluria sp.]|nr:hypothetical protein [Telluria sp.]
MNRRFAFRLLLSMVLLLSQHMAMAHAISHWAGAGRAPVARVQDEGGELSRAVAEDPACAKCLAFAQIGCAPPCADYVFAPAVDRHAAPASLSAALPGAGPIRAFNPRAPPVPA